jgi:hypothetical protein
MVTKRVWYSDTVTTIFVPEGFDANDVINTAYYRYDLLLGRLAQRNNGDAGSASLPAALPAIPKSHRRSHNT